jgi:hypothetical protein
MNSFFQSFIWCKDIGKSINPYWPGDILKSLFDKQLFKKTGTYCFRTMAGSDRIGVNWNPLYIKPLFINQIVAYKTKNVFINKIVHYKTKTFFINKGCKENLFLTAFIE